MSNDNLYQQIQHAMKSYGIQDHAIGSHPGYKNTAEQELDEMKRRYMKASRNIYEDFYNTGSKHAHADFEPPEPDGFTLPKNHRGGIIERVMDELVRLGYLYKDGQKYVLNSHPTDQHIKIIIGELSDDPIAKARALKGLELYDI